MDAGIIRSFKTFYRTFSVRKRIVTLEAGNDFSVDVFQAIKWIRRAWACVTSETIKNCFGHVGIGEVDAAGNASEEFCCTQSPMLENEYIDVDINLLTTDSQKEPQIATDEPELSDEEPEIVVEKPKYVDAVKAVAVLGDFFCDSEEAENMIERFQELLLKNKPKQRQPSLETYFQSTC